MTDPLSSSSVENLAALLARVQQRLRDEASGNSAAGPGSRPDPEFDLSRPDGLGHGWFHAETLDGRTVRWTARQFEFEAGVDQATHLYLEAALFVESGFTELHARLAANGNRGGEFRIRPGWNRYIVALPAGLRSPARITVDLGGAWCPLASGHGPDARELGILVARLALVPFLQVPAPPPKGATLRARVLRRLRRLLFGHELESRLMHLEGRTSEVEDRTRLLAESDREQAGALEEAERELRREISRQVRLGRR
ncbi:MAG TPA: hypothetical protein VLH41_00735 [Thermoanaerobaculia bacterium]|nr:hypothetical protein [Thermoanaerobaculia bacterium]